MTRRTDRTIAETRADFRAKAQAHGVREITLDTPEKEEAFWAQQNKKMRARFGNPQMTEAERAMYARLEQER